MITAERVREVLDYNPDNGVFTWIKTCSTRAMSGSVAGTRRKNKYIQIRVDKKIYLAHRLAWLHFYGSFPPEEIDHINRVRDDNRIENLRAATKLENMQNLPKHKRNTSGILGVSRRNETGKWDARIHVNGRDIRLGSYSTIEEAAAIRAEAKAKYHTFHPEDDS